MSAETGLLCRYMALSGGEVLRAAELMGRDLMRGERASCKAGYSAASAALAAQTVFRRSGEEVSAEEVLGRLRAWGEGREEAIEWGAIADSVELRCPDCCSPEVGGSAAGLMWRCGNCGASFKKHAAYLTLADAAGYAAETSEAAR
ncbi:MAG TPA: hypothetical protein VII45_09085 [Solirubrobacterales bacterium]